ncbi:hypothetical protein HDE_05577 [Halotydeus destructor]|nr:hypothetical protein HDE_05577 [Halotydeus destructor]
MMSVLRIEHQLAQDVIGTVLVLVLLLLITCLDVEVMYILDNRPFDSNHNLINLLDEEILLILSYVSVWDVFCIEATCLRLRYVVSVHFRTCRRLSFATPQKFADETLVQNFVEGTKRTVLARCGPCLEFLHFNLSRISLWHDDKFVLQLADKCPNLRKFFTNNVDMALTYARATDTSKSGLKELKFLALEDEELDKRPRLLRWCPNVQKIHIQLVEPSLDWLLDVVHARTVRAKHYSFDIICRLRNKLVEDIRRVIFSSPNVQTVHFNIVSDYSVDTIQNLIRALPVKISIRLMIDSVEEIPQSVASCISSLVLHHSQCNIFYGKHFEQMDELVMTKCTSGFCLRKLSSHLPKSLVRLCLVRVSNIDGLSYMLAERGEHLERLVLETYFVDSNYHAAESFSDLLTLITINCTSLKCLSLSVVHQQAQLDKLLNLIAKLGHGFKTLELEKLVPDSANYVLLLEHIDRHCRILKSIAIEVLWEPSGRVLDTTAHFVQRQPNLIFAHFTFSAGKRLTYYNGRCSISSKVINHESNGESDSN